MWGTAFVAVAFRSLTAFVTPTQRWTQNSPGVIGAAESFDHFGYPD